MKAQNIRKTGLMLAMGAFALCAGMAQAQDNVASPDTAAPMPSSVADVLKLGQAKVSDSTIVAFVQNSGNTYHLDASQIIYLRDHGLSDAVLTAMLSNQPMTTAGAANGQSTGETPPAPPDVTSTGDTTDGSQPTVIYVNSAPVYYYPAWSFSWWWPVGVTWGWAWWGGCWHWGCHNGSGFNSCGFWNHGFHGSSGFHTANGFHSATFHSANGFHTVSGFHSVSGFSTANGFHGNINFHTVNGFHGNTSFNTVNGFHGNISFHTVNGFHGMSGGNVVHFGGMSGGGFHGGGFNSGGGMHFGGGGGGGFHGGGFGGGGHGR